MSGRSLVLGQFYPAKSPLHALDPRVKLFLTLTLVISLFFIDNIAILISSAILIPILAKVAKLPYRWILRGVRPLVFILSFTFLIHLFLTEGELFFRLGPLIATWDGLVKGIFYSSRLVLVILFSSFITLTTSPVQLTDAIESFFNPLKVFRFPAHEIALMMTIALRFIPTILGEAETIMKAQKARGANFDSGNILKRARSFVPLLIPLFISSFRRADELALAMEARGYAGGEGRTRMRQLKIEPIDLAWLIIGLLVIFSIVGVSWWV
ncbi:MAG TPA: energy-coupling factor transporter transmembrane protein EcfT [Actinobacteria bacterium]|nr:energy-coupling factor transporter transmembrane protein EcfT [Actinomycetota bacterium]